MVAFVLHITRRLAINDIKLRGEDSNGLFIKFFAALEKHLKNNIKGG